MAPTVERSDTGTAACSLTIEYRLYGLFQCYQKGGIMNNAGKVNYLKAKGYDFYCSTTDMIKRNDIEATGFFASMPADIQKKAKFIVYTAKDNTLFLMDNYGRCLHTPQIINW